MGACCLWPQSTRPAIWLMIFVLESSAEDADTTTPLCVPVGGGSRRCLSRDRAVVFAVLRIRNAVEPPRIHGLRILRRLSNPSSMSTASGNPKKHLIERKLTEGLAPALLQVEDVSHQHAGHAGAPKGSSETHFNMTVVSDQFQGRTLLKRHRLVYDLLHDELQHGGVHALSLNTKTPAEVAPKP